MKISKQQLYETLRRSWMQVTLGVILLLPLAIGLSLVYKAWPLLKPSMLQGILFGTEWVPLQGKFGLWPFIWSSLLVSVMGLVFMIPVCLCSAIYITQYAPRWIFWSLRSVIDILAGIPSVIFGLWGMITVVPLVAELAKTFDAENITGYSVLAAAVVVSFSVLPFILNMLIELFSSVSSELKESALSLGASYLQVIKDVIVRKLRPGIIATFTLGVSKAFGETIAVLMVVGNVVQIPSSLFSPGYPLPALLANNYGEMMTIPMYDAALMLSALLLLIIVVLFNYLAHSVIRYYFSKL